MLRKNAVRSRGKMLTRSFGAAMATPQMGSLSEAQVALRIYAEQRINSLASVMVSPKQDELDGSCTIQSLSDIRILP